MDKDKIKNIITDSVKELTEDISKGYSDRIKEYLEWKAKFHNYSFWNTILIYIQRPDAEYVRGFMQWKNMGYHVNKRSKAIHILAPQTAKYIYRKYPDGKEDKVFWKDMTELERKRTLDHQTLNYFRGVSVFDIKDTNCKEYPTFFTELGNDHEKIYHAVKEAVLPEVKIEEEATGKAQGFYDLAQKCIVIKPGDYNNMILILTHELAHWYCDNHIENYKNEYNYKDGEIHAESVSFVICKYLGIDNPFSKDYIINWKGSIDKVQKNFSLIDKVSTNLINMIEKGSHATKKRLEQEREDETDRGDAGILQAV
jgi:hypothetical protein